MNRVVTIVSFSLAVPAFVALFGYQRPTLILTTIASFVLCVLCFWVESIIKTKGFAIANRIMYFLSRSRAGYIEKEKRFIYERLSDNNWKFTKQYTLLSRSNTLDGFDDRFCWSVDSSNAGISAINDEHRVCNIRQQEIWTVYTVKFNKIVAKGEEIQTGTVIDNLEDKNKKAVPFLSATISAKTKVLKMTVKIPKQYHPSNAKFEVFSSANTDARISSCDLEYNEAEQGFTKMVLYPRRNWKYVITWDCEN